MSFEDPLKEKLYSVISTNLGEDTKKLFIKFYEGESIVIMLEEANKLLVEFLGEEKAKEQLDPIYTELKEKTP